MTPTPSVAAGVRTGMLRAAQSDNSSVRTAAALGARSPLRIRFSDRLSIARESRYYEITAGRTAATLSKESKHANHLVQPRRSAQWNSQLFAVKGKYRRNTLHGTKDAVDFGRLAPHCVLKD